MKALLFSLCLISFSAVANAALVGDFPKVQFGSTFVSVEDICVKGDHVQTINEVTVCVKRNNRRNGYCAEEQDQILSTPRNYTKEIEVGHHKFKVIDVTIALDYKIPFGYASKNGIRVVKIEDFSLPVCE